MTTTAPLTLDQFVRLSEEKPAREFACGEVLQKPMPTQAHVVLQQYLFLMLWQFLQKARLGDVRIEWRCVFGPAGQERALVPDVVVVRAERMPHGDARRMPYLLAAPDLAIEVLSPDQPARQFADKLLFYLRHGVRLVWVVDPDAEIVNVYAPDAEPRLLTRDDTLDGGDLLPGFALPLAELFAQLQV